MHYHFRILKRSGSLVAKERKVACQLKQDTISFHPLKWSYDVLFVSQSVLYWINLLRITLNSKCRNTAGAHKAEWTRKTQYPFQITLVEIKKKIITKKPHSVSPVNLRGLVDKHNHQEILPLVTLQRQPPRKVLTERWYGNTWDSDCVAGLNCRESAPNPKNSEVILLQFAVLGASHSLCPAGKEYLFFVVVLLLFPSPAPRLPPELSVTQWNSPCRRARLFKAPRLLHKHRLLVLFWLTVQVS